MKLLVEMLPEQTWGINIRNNQPGLWDMIRRECYRKAGYRCEICGGKGPKHPVEAHEVWKFARNTQKLIGTIALCPACHNAKHLGYSRLKGDENKAIKRIAKINGWTVDQANAHIDEERELWEKRCKKKKWVVDTTEYGGRKITIE